MSSIAPTRVLVRCDGAEVPAWLGSLSWSRELPITSRGPRADLNLRVDDLAGVLGAEVSTRAIDLVRIAAYAYQADRLVSRGGDRDADAARWRRHLGLCVPVADPDYWGDQAVTDRLVETLQFLTDDRWAFAFSRAVPEQRQLHLLTGARPLHREPGAVVLFSGGADSLGVLVEAALAGERPLLVGHWSAPPHEARQRALLDRLRERFPAWSFPPLGLRIHGVKTEPPERTQRTRAFLYAALGAAVAAEVGVDQVSLGDNGPVSLNLPISGQLVGALASRSTHPKFLDALNHLLDGMFAAPVRVKNPLWARTRPEGLATLKEAGCADLLQETLSCSRWSRLPGATPQCGTCSQCIDRRFAVIAAGLETHDRAERYKRDVFVHKLPEGRDRTTAEAYVRFAQDVHGRSDEELVIAYPQLLDGVLPHDPDAGGTLATLVDLLKRHARTTMNVLETMTTRHVGALVEGRLPATCLLRLALAAPVAAPEGVAQVVDPVVATVSTAAPPVSATQVGPAIPHDSEFTSEPQNLFAFEGEMWTLRYQGTSTHMRPNVGLTRIAPLLARPYHWFTAAELLATTASAGGGRMSGAEMEEEGLRPERYAGGGMVFDQDTADDLESEIKRLLRELDDARDVGNRQREAVLEAKVKRLVKEKNAGVGLGGRLKPFADNLTRSQDAIYQSIHRIIPRITEVHRPLGTHLHRAVRHGSSFCYEPETPVTWRVVLPPPKPKG